MEKQILIPDGNRPGLAREVSQWTILASKNGIVLPNGDIKPSMLPKSPDQIMGLFALGWSVLVCVDDKPVAHAAITFEWPDNWLEIGAVVTREEYRQRGLASSAVNALISITRKKYPEKRLFALCNTLSLNLFLKLGGSIMDGRGLPDDVWSECVNCKNFRAAKQAGKVCCDTPVNITGVTVR